MKARSRACAGLVFLLAACNAAPQGNPLGLLPNLSMPAGHPDRSRSWMSPAAKNAKELLYISDDSTYDVFVYDYPSAALVGKLTGFNEPIGICVDKIGDVWITNYGGGSVSEYAHGGSKALQTLSLGSFQTGCSIDPTTGDLAVTELYGLMAIFKHARGSPKNYTSSACPAFWSPGYDAKGNLYVESLADSKPEICELPQGANKLRAVSSNVPVVYPAGTMWDGKYMTFADQEYGDRLITAVYQARESASGDLTYVGTTVLNDPCGASSVLQPFILGKTNTPLNDHQGTVVIGDNNSCLGIEDIWAYPAGGSPSRFADPPAFPNGQAVSFKT